MGTRPIKFRKATAPTSTELWTESGCPDYNAPDIVFSLKFKKLKNSEYATTASSIVVKIEDANGSAIAQVIDGLAATIIPGLVGVKPLVASPSDYVMDTASLRISMQPVDEVTADSQIVIRFPTSDSTLTLPSTCSISDRGALMSPSSTCSVSSSAFII